MTRLHTRREFMAAALTTASAAALSRAQWAQAAPTEKQPVKIALICDTHTTRGTKEDQPQHKERLDRVIAAVNAWKPDWVLHGGDLTESAKPEEISDFREQIQSLQAPIDWVYGNHDVGAKRVEDQKTGLSAERVERIETALGPSFWEKTRAGVRVVATNTSLINSGFERETEQWAFLEKAFAAPSTGPTLFLGHYPPFIKTPDEEEDPYWNIAPGPRARLLELVRKGGATAMLSGHLHRPLSLQFEKMPLIVGPAVCFGLPRETQMVGWTQITISPQGQFAYELQPVEK
jgi:3',5'-cyclic AMP phosphodiesterase CpdA